MGHLVIYQDN